MVASRITSSLSLLMLAASLCACHPEPPCEPGARGCDEPERPPPPPLSEGEARAELGQLHARFELAAADGLEPEECKQLTADYQALFERDPSLTAARFNVAAVAEACGELDRAEAIYVELAAVEHPQALNNLGVMLWARGEHERAFTLFERSVAADSIHALAARNNLAMALRERYTESLTTADFEAAERELKNILALDSANKAAYENLARLYYDRGRLEDRSDLVLANLVVTQAQRVLEAVGTRSADLHNLRGLLLMEDDNQVHALRAFKRAVEIDAEHVDANRNIAMISIRFRDYATAEAALEAVLDVPEVAADVEVWLALGVARRGLRKYDAAAEAYRKALEVDGSDPRAHYNLGVLAQDHLSGAAEDDALLAVYDEALKHYRDFVAHAGDSPRWRSEVAEASDRIVIVEDSIDTIENMKRIEEAYQDMLRREAEARAAEIERLKQREAEGTSVGELVGSESEAS